MLEVERERGIERRKPYLLEHGITRHFPGETSFVHSKRLLLLANHYHREAAFAEIESGSKTIIIIIIITIIINITNATFLSGRLVLFWALLQVLRAEH